jgi:branched-chain amino acid transport system ATP-binding protein
MSPAERVQMARLIDVLPRDLRIVIVEHDMDVIFRQADRISVLHDGHVLAEGAPEEIKANLEEVYFRASPSQIYGA